MNQKRQPKGIETGGQYAPDVNQESTVVLNDDVTVVRDYSREAIAENQAVIYDAQENVDLILGRYESRETFLNSDARELVDSMTTIVDKQKEIIDELEAKLHRVDESPETPDIRFGPGGIREWYEDGEFVPPPIGTEIDVNEARALPSYTEVMATFDATGDREFRLMARDLPRYSDAEHPTDSHLSRRFTNLDTGNEVFLGGNGGMNSTSSTVNLTKIRVVVPLVF